MATQPFSMLITLSNHSHPSSAGGLGSSIDSLCFYFFFFFKFTFPIYPPTWVAIDHHTLCPTLRTLSPFLCCSWLARFFGASFVLTYVLFLFISPSISFPLLVCFLPISFMCVRDICGMSRGIPLQVQKLLVLFELDLPCTEKAGLVLCLA